MAAASDLPFEVHAYEALLTTVTVLETQEFNKVNAQVQVILGYFRTGTLTMNKTLHKCFFQLRLCCFNIRSNNMKYNFSLVITRNMFVFNNKH